MNIVIVDDNAVNLLLMAALARAATGFEPMRFDTSARTGDGSARTKDDLWVIARVKPGVGLDAKAHPGFHPGYEGGRGARGPKLPEAALTGNSTASAPGPS